MYFFQYCSYCFTGYSNIAIIGVQLKIIYTTKIVTMKNIQDVSFEYRQATWCTSDIDTYQNDIRSFI